MSLLQAVWVAAVHLAVVDLVGVKLGALLASLRMAFLVLGFDAPESVPFAGCHQVPAHERQVPVVAPEEIAFIGPLAVVVSVNDLYVVESDRDRCLDAAKHCQYEEQANPLSPP